MGRNRGGYPFSTLGRVTVAPLPPTSKITEISAQGFDNMVPFVDGWQTSPIWGGGDPGDPDTNFKLYFKGTNLTEEYIRKQDMYSVINGSRTDISVMFVNETAGGFVADMVFEASVKEGDRYQFVIGETISGEMALEGGKLV